MRKFIAILLLLFCTAKLFAQTEIDFFQSNGNTLRYNIDSISKITFTKESPPKYNVMSVFSRSIIPNPVGYRTGGIDSITFLIDTLSIHGQGAPTEQYFIIGDPKRNPPIDSMTFASFENDTNVITLSDGYSKYWDCQLQYFDVRDYKCTLWLGSHIYFSDPFGYFAIDSNYSIIYDSTFCPVNQYGGLSFAADSKGLKFLNVISNQYFNISLGKLFEYDHQKGEQNFISVIPDTNIGSAEYFTDDSILYYSYGKSFSMTNLKPQEQGYYFYNRITGETSSFLQFISDAGPEPANGFDISPDRKKLLIPVTPINQVPFIIEYDFATKNMDTLHIDFDNPNGRQWSLWLRYSHDGKRILYDLYPINTFGNGPGLTYGRETCVIERISLSRKVLNLNPTSEGTWVSVFPNWSPNDNEIVYCASSISIEPPGDLGGFQVCVLKHLP